jgi:uncharacterized protein
MGSAPGVVVLRASLGSGGAGAAIERPRRVGRPGRVCRWTLDRLMVAPYVPAMDAAAHETGAVVTLPASIVESGPLSGADARGRLEGLAEREVLDEIARASVGRVAFVVDGWPVVLPVNFVMDGRDVVFRTDPGAKLTASAGGRVCFQADGSDSLYERGWSALGFGIADRVVDPEELERLQQKGLRPWAGGAKAFWVRIRVQQWTGRRLPRAWRYPMPRP